MNLNPNQPDPGMPDETIDASLLDAALAEPTPAELEAKILALTDPSMVSLLDAALAPEPASDELTQRILAATSPDSSPRLAGSAARRAGIQPAPTVLARIGPATFRFAAAAAIAVAAGLGVWFVNQGPGDTDRMVAGAIETPDVAADDDNTTDDASDPDWLAQEQYVSSAQYFGDETEQIEDVLNSVADGLDDATITRDTLWAEFDAYVAFLDDIES